MYAAPGLPVAPALMRPKDPTQYQDSTPCITCDPFEGDAQLGSSGLALSWEIRDNS